MIKHKNRLDKSDIQACPGLQFDKPIVVVATQADAQEAYHYLMHQEQLGFDTETRPAFRKGEVHPVALVQLSSPQRAYIFQLKHSGFHYVQQLLESATICKIGLGLKDDLKCLRRSFADLAPKNMIDLATIAKQKGIIQTGIRALSARYLKQRISKSVQLSNWENKILTEKQIKYAACDAWVCLQIYPLLQQDDTDYQQLKDQELAREHTQKKQEQQSQRG